MTSFEVPAVPTRTELTPQHHCTGPAYAREQKIKKYKIKTKNTGAVRESNPRPLPPEGRIIPLDQRPKYHWMVASSEDRTRDLTLTKRMLCQLSYRGCQQTAQVWALSAAPAGLPRTLSLHPCVHSTRVVFNPSKVKIRVRVPMNALCGRHSLGAGPRLVAPIAWVRIPVTAFLFLFIASCFTPLRTAGVHSTRRTVISR